jgi:EpsG family
VTDYAIVLVPTCLLALAASQLALQAQRQVVAALTLVLTAFAAARGYVGTDTGAYHTMFTDYGSEQLVDLTDIVEPVFALMIWASAALSDNSFIFVSAIAVVQGSLLLLVLARHERPAMFMALYASTFYLNFHFNILRSGTSALLLLLAISSLRAGERIRFYAYGFASLLSHYSALAFFLPLNLTGRRFSSGLLWLFVSGAAALGLMLVFVNEARYVQYLTYLALLDAGDSVQYGFGLLALFVLYALVFAATVSRSNYKALTFLFLVWAATRLASNYMLFVSRIEVVINLILLSLLIGSPPRHNSESLRTAALVLLVMLNLYGNLVGLEAADQSARGGFSADPYRRNSTYIPYKFAWEE